MQFNDNMPIYLQIADRICENILSGKWGSDCRIPSVREMGAEYQVNPNTMMRSYDYLQQKNIIYNKRGIGYFVSPGSISLILEDQRKKLIDNDLPQMIKKMLLLGFGPENAIEAIRKEFDTVLQQEKPINQ
ncbi:MAG: GntR family transcriptional regulator [Bacteroidetes bacterium]|uniref:GntR family transcriptional regulator n=1 Tax=Candidatus Merdivivens pullistercoris TaxID=2840873 RepID=A0A9D9I5B4_9BACT|nr:GntR family transcriptional regulator [Candidatus Merdivivens pullistercoris]